MVLLCPGLAVLINLVAANRQCQFSCWHVLLVGASHIPVLCNLFPASELVPTILNGSRQPVNPAICVALPPLECINFCHLCFVGGRLYCLNWWCLMMENEKKSDVSLFCIIFYRASWMAGLEPRTELFVSAIIQGCFFISGQSYFVNKYTKESQWETPTKPAERGPGGDKVWAPQTSY